MVDEGHEDILDDVEEDVGREKGANRDVKAVSKLEDFCSSRAAWWGEEALLPPATGEACNPGSQQATHEVVCYCGDEK